MNLITGRLFHRRVEVSTKRLRGSKLLREPRVWFIAGWLVLFLIAIRTYDGSAAVYALFSVLFLALLASATIKQRTYGYTFLVIFLWLGFWLKVSWHLAWGNGFPEPTGHFTASASHWDHALIVSNVGALAILCARLIFELLAPHRKTLQGGTDAPPKWLTDKRRWHWALFLITVLAVAFANFHFHVFVIGLKTGAVLTWPLNALITLMLVGGGFSAWMAVLLWYEMRSGGSIFRCVILLIVSAFVITASSLSRGVIVLLLVPLAYAAYLNANWLKDLSRHRAVVLLLILCGTLGANFFLITHVRDGFYFQKRAEVVESEEEARVSAAMKPMVKIGKQVVGLVNFSIDRWVGIEGVMAVSAYPKLGKDLYLRALAEPPVKTEPSIYAMIAPWPYRQGDITQGNVSFMSLPGGLAFLYYLGSLWLVFVLMTVLVVALQYLEVLVFMVTRNPLLCASIAWLLALMIAHFGGAPKSQLPALLFLSMVVLLIGGLQSRWLESLTSRSRARP